MTVIAAGSLIDEQIIDTFTELENTQLFMNIMAVNFENEIHRIRNNMAM